ncbi:uncharacterized protein LOC123532122 [Mercenaria mercenaria]|uniref:uncharacterized protein LOC123532122 n=1 Tax=Mercenaria mercenaria TaxID=6596 RepID=UPI00234E7D6B|nr:uncharacterized protein LOC123532122 [Mercenaria mercenaria]
MGCNSSTRTIPEKENDRKKSFDLVLDTISEVSLKTVSKQDMVSAYESVESLDDINLGKLAKYKKISKQYLKGGSFHHLVNTDVFALEDQNALEDIAKTLLLVANLGSVLDGKTTMSRVGRFQKDVTRYVRETGIDKFCYRTIKNFDLDKEKYKNTSHKNVKFAIATRCLLILKNYCECSEDLAINVSEDKDIMSFLRNILTGGHKDIVEKESQTLNKEETDKRQQYEAEYGEEIIVDPLIDFAMDTIYHISIWDTNFNRLRDLDLLEALEPYLKSGLRLVALLTIANIVDEEECKIIKSHTDVVEELLNILRQSMNEKSRRYNTWSSRQCGLGIRRLARNDVNKKMLSDFGAIELLVKLSDGDEDEQLESVQALWYLTFDSDIRKKIVGDQELGVVDVLIELSKSKNNRIRKTCIGALWTLRGDLADSNIKEYKRAAIGIERSKAVVDTSRSQHIMISYHWSNQKEMKTICKRIKQAGFKVWMDIEKLEGSTVDAMADAVENSKVVLVCMSRKYKNSPNCRAEANYAFQKQRRIIPLKMERGYQPDGWLGFIIGTLKYYEFSGHYSFDEKMKELIKGLQTAYTDEKED